MADFVKTFKIIWFGIKNNRVLAGFMTLLCLVILPAFSIVMMDGNPHHTAVGIYGCVAAYFGGFFIPMSMFNYLHRKQEYDFYSAMPVKKAQYFWGYFVSGFLIFLIPCLIMFVIHYAMGSNGFQKYFVQTVTAFLVIYCSTILCTVFSGSGTSTVVSVFLLNGLAVSLVALPLMIAGVDAKAYVELLYYKISVFTPVTSAVGVVDSSFFNAVAPWQLLIAALETAAAFFLHKYRGNESTTALAFPRFRYFYQYTVMLVFTLAVDAVMLFGTDSYSIYTGFNGFGIDGFPVIVFFTVLAVLIVFIILNIILERNPKAAFKKIRHLFIFSAGYGLLLMVAVGVCRTFIPISVLPFTPESVVIRVYEIKEYEGDEDNSIHDYDYCLDNIQWDYPIYSDGNLEYSEEPIQISGSRHYYKSQEMEEFTVADPEAVKTLVQYAMEPTRIYWYWDNEVFYSSSVCILARGESFPNFSYIDTDIDDDKLECFYIFEAEYYDADSNQKSVREGFACEYEYISKFKG